MFTGKAGHFEKKYLIFWRFFKKNFYFKFVANISKNLQNKFYIETFKTKYSSN